MLWGLDRQCYNALANTVVTSAFKKGYNSTGLTSTSKYTTLPSRNFKQAFEKKYLCKKS